MLACLFGSFLYIDGLLVLMCPVRPDLCCVLSDHYTRLFHYDRFWLMFTHTCRKILYSDSPIRSIVLNFVFKIHFNLKKALKCTILTINWHDDFYKILQKNPLKWHRFHHICKSNATMQLSWFIRNSNVLYLCRFRRRCIIIITFSYVQSMNNVETRLLRPYKTL